MSNDLPPPEGELIRRARERQIPKLTIRAAAARAAISQEHWGNIERGYKSVSAADPPRRLPPAGAVLLAKMATVAGASADEMETDGERPDVAREMRRNTEETAHRQFYADQLHNYVGTAPGQRGPAEQLAQDIYARAVAERTFQPDGPIAGSAVSDDEDIARLWDALEAAKEVDENVRGMDFWREALAVAAVALRRRRMTGGARSAG